MLLDVSVALRPGLPHWPGQPGFERTVERSVDEGDRVTISTLRLGAHTGTHVDGPVHFLPRSPGTEAIDLEACVGPAFVADLRALGGAITAEHLDAAGVPDATTRLLAKTRNSGWSRDESFREDFCAYDGSAARWCVERGMRLVGIDYLSIEPFGSGDIGNPTHRTLLEAGVVVLEGIDLADAEPGEWDVIALPVLVPGGDGAPARVLLRR
jgi:arylformamidase